MPTETRPLPHGLIAVLVARAPYASRPQPVRWRRRIRTRYADQSPSARRRRAAHRAWQRAYEDVVTQPNRPDPA